MAGMIYIVQHVCGHDQTHQFFGPSRERDHKRRFVAEQPCRDCLARITLERAEDHTEKYALPDLVGTDKQKVWALTLRYQTLVIIDRVVSAEVFTDRVRIDAARHRLHTINDAHWWIDNAKDVAQAGRRIKIGLNDWTEFGMLTERDFAKRLLASQDFDADGPRTTTELLASSDPADWGVAVMRGRE
jgi:hypothetical protein